MRSANVRLQRLSRSGRTEWERVAVGSQVSDLRSSARCRKRSQKSKKKRRYLSVNKLFFFKKNTLSLLPLKVLSFNFYAHTLNWRLSRWDRNFFFFLIEEITPRTLLTTQNMASNIFCSVTEAHFTCRGSALSGRRSTFRLRDKFHINSC